MRAASRQQSLRFHSETSGEIGILIFLIFILSCATRFTIVKAEPPRLSSVANSFAGSRFLLATDYPSNITVRGNHAASSQPVGNPNGSDQTTERPFHSPHQVQSPPGPVQLPVAAAPPNGSSRSLPPPRQRSPYSSPRLRSPPRTPSPSRPPPLPPAPPRLPTRPRAPLTPRPPKPPQPQPPSPRPPRPAPPPPSPSPPSPSPPSPPQPSPPQPSPSPPYSPPSPRPSFILLPPSQGAKVDTLKNGLTESVEADIADDGEADDEPAWPPQQPTPPRPINTPSPPPPASAAEIGRFHFIGNAMMIAVHLLAVPGTDRFFFMERPSGRHPDGSRTIAGFLDLPTRRWTHVTSPDGLFCAGHTFLRSGDLLVVGGHQANAGYPDGMRSIRTFNRSCTDLQLRKVRDMGWRRWYPTTTLLPSGKVLIMGGTQGVGAGTANNQFWELYDHSSHRLTPYAMRSAYLDSAQQVYYPFNYVLPSGLLFTFCGRTGWILNWTNNTWTQPVPRLRGYGSTQYPFTGTSVMLGLYPERDYQVEIMLFGGQAERAVRNLSTVATRAAQRLRLTYDTATGNYTFEGWTEESMSMGRLMGDSVLLPNGKVVVLNGAREGLAGDSASGGDSRANYPVLFADLYDPDLPHGSRFRRLALSRIPRMYHSTACLTTNGTILVAGCDRCHRFFVDPAWSYDPSPTGKTDYRLEIFSPPYIFNDAARPRIELVQGDVMLYGKPYDIAYSFPAAVATATASAHPHPKITRVVLMAPCSCTHSYDMNQRLVGLRILSDWGPTGRGNQEEPVKHARSLSELYTSVVDSVKNNSSGSGSGSGNSASGAGPGEAAAAGSGVAAAASDTDSFNDEAAPGGVLTVGGPPNANIAPPGMYMLFLLSGEIYSSAVWVRLEHPPP
ncbi:hypothetical protein Vafri_13205 [Volvox africanus]|uniref:Glyoxal or galactose oxidase n=1 Tax=Volvox africanus TaxID=51714 RepID=A0A8J4BBF4_9CHLO|nr:hypothetical protein Vafri_13205 [Volvox africanus]